jgi:hypothetical protein
MESRCQYRSHCPFHQHQHRSIISMPTTIYHCKKLTHIVLKLQNKVLLCIVAHRRVRRNYIVRCCGGRSCSYSSRSRFSQSRWTSPNHDVALRGRSELLGGDRAVATLRDGGVSVSCPGCARGWQQQLKISPKQGHIPIVCPGCDAGWRQWLSEDAYAAAIDATSTTVPDKQEVRIIVQSLTFN